MDLNEDLSKNMKNRKQRTRLIYLPKGLRTTPEWLFESFTEKSLAKHGIKEVKLTAYSITNRKRQVQLTQYRINLNKGDLACLIDGNIPITYLGNKVWTTVED